MGRWTNAWGCIQVIYLILLTISVVLTTLYISAQLFSDSEATLYARYKGELEDPDDPEYTEREVYVASYVVKGSVLFVIPACLLIYRSRLL